MARGLYSNPEGARGVLDAIGGAPRSRQGAAPRAAFRGICGNGAHPALRVSGHKAEHCGGVRCNGGEDCRCQCRGCTGAERRGCQNEVSAEHPNHLKFCDACLSRYLAAMPRHREHVAHLDRVQHDPRLCYHGQRRGECGTCQSGR